MITTKRLIALLMSLVLAFTLALPAFAETEAPEVNPAMPVITVQPESVTILNGSSYTLSVQAEIPNGDPLRYEWYELGTDRIVSDEASFSAGISVQFANTTDSARFYYYVIVFNANDETLFVQSETVSVTVEQEYIPWGSARNSVQDFLYLLFVETPFYLGAWLLVMLLAPISFPFIFFFPFGPILLLLLIAAPILWPFMLISEFFALF